MSRRRGMLGRRRFLHGAGTLAAGLAGAVLIGCQSGSESDSTTTTPAGSSASPGSTTAPGATSAPETAVTYGGELILAQAGNPPTLDPHLSTAANTTNFGRLFYDQLAIYDITEDPADLTIVPSLADSIEVVDASTFRFTLRPGTRMQNRAPMNGRELVAEDVRYSFDRLRAPESPVAGVYEPIESIEIVDARTLVFHLKTAYAPFLAVVAEPQTSWIVPPETVEEDGDLTKRPGGTGPFLFDSFEAGVRYRADRNPDYFREGFPRVDRVTRLIQGDASALLAAFSTRQLHVTSGNPIVIDQLRSLEPDLRTTSRLSETTSAFVMNNRIEPFNDDRVRRAIMRAIDQQRLLDVVHSGAGAFSGPVPPGLGMWALPEEEIKTAYSQDLTEATQLLQAAIPGGFSFPIVVYSGQTVYSQFAELIQQDLQAIGVQTNIDVQDQAVGRQNVIDGNFEAALPTGKTTALEVDLHLRDNYASTGSRNWAGFFDEQVEEWLGEQLVETNEELRLEITNNIQRRVIELLPEIFLPVALSTNAVRPEVEDFWLSVNGDRPSEVFAWLNS